MEQELEEDLFNVINRWESLGLLDGLPIREKSELALIYDNATKLVLSDYSIKKIPKKVSDLMDETFIPICRRLYRRLGPNFDLENMLSELLSKATEEVDVLSNKKSGDSENPIVSFCIDFCDNYEDDVTNQSLLSNEEYEQKIDELLVAMRSVLLNDLIVSRVDIENGLHIKTVNTVKPKSITRFSNQSSAKQLLSVGLSNINKNF